MRRVLEPRAYAHWLSTFLPGISGHAKNAWLAPAVLTDRADPKLAHLDGLNLSRAWMLEGMAQGLPAGDPYRRALRRGSLVGHLRGVPHDRRGPEVSLAVHRRSSGSSFSNLPV
jgi:hypothetical protein